VEVLAPPDAAALFVVETLPPAAPALAPVVVLAPTPVFVLVPTPGVLVVPVTPVPIPVLPPTLPPVVTPVDWAWAAAPATIRAAARLIVLSIGDSSKFRGINRSLWRRLPAAKAGLAY
jgi:hypothetical protein